MARSAAIITTKGATNLSSFVFILNLRYEIGVYESGVAGQRCVAGFDVSPLRGFPFRISFPSASTTPTRAKSARVEDPVSALGYVLSSLRNFPQHKASTTKWCAGVVTL